MFVVIFYKYFEIRLSYPMSRVIFIHYFYAVAAKIKFWLRGLRPELFMGYPMEHAIRHHEVHPYSIYSGF